MSPKDHDEASWLRLTDKQRDCLDLLLERKTSKQIARLLDISKPTVDQRITAARTTLGAMNRDEAAIIYARLKAVYDRSIYDPMQLPQPPQWVPSDFSDGDPETAFTLSDSRSPRIEDEQGYRKNFPPPGGLWGHDLGSYQRITIMVAMLIATVIVLLAGLGIAQALSGLISN